jgi:hypothetical protein
MQMITISCIWLIGCGSHLAVIQRASDIHVEPRREVALFSAASTVYCIRVYRVAGHRCRGDDFAHQDLRPYGCGGKKRQPQGRPKY